MKYLVALAAGAILPLSLEPFGWWPLGLLSVGLLFHLLRTFPANAGWLGWVFGVGKYGVGVSWVYVSIHVYGNAPPALAGGLVVLFVAGLAVFSWAMAVTYRWLRSAAPMLDAVVFVCVFVGFEWLLTWVLTGFPWLYPAYAHLATPLAGFAPVGGVLLVSLVLTVASCFAVVTVSARRRGVPAVLAVLPWLIGWPLSQVQWVAPDATRKVALVQGNVDQAVKWLPENRGRIVDTYLRLTEPHWGVDVIVWPEAAITIMEHRAQSVLAELQRRGAATDTALVLGLPAVERLPTDRVVFRNTATVVGSGSGRYVKRRLVPFGEYVPLEHWLRGTIEFFDLPMSRAEPGAWRQPLLRLGEDLASMGICYEVVYPELMRAPAADVLLTISNDSWFGSSIGPPQHLQMAQMRALENGRWLLRATNNGITAIIDHRGRVAARLPQFEAGVLAGEYQVMRGATPYARWGDWPVLAVLALGLAFGAWRRHMR